MIQTVPPSPAAQLSLPLSAINLRAQIRTRNGLDEASLRELSASIRTHGVLQPVVVTPSDDGAYWLVAGERRILAASMAGLDEVPAVVRTGTPAELAAAQATENLQREDLSPLDIAEALSALASAYPQQKDLAAAIGKSPTWVSKHKSLTKLPPALHEVMADNTCRDVELILDLATLGRIKTPTAQHRFTQLLKATRDGLATRAMVRTALAAEKKPKPAAPDDETATDETDETAPMHNPTAAVFANLKLSPNGLRIIIAALTAHAAAEINDRTQAEQIAAKARQLYSDLLAR